MIDAAWTAPALSRGGPRLFPYAAADYVSTFSKMHAFEEPGERSICLLSAGNLATTQAVLRQIRRDNKATRDRA